jgi:hypothetical protein
MMGGSERETRNRHEQKIDVIQPRHPLAKRKGVNRGGSSGFVESEPPSDAPDRDGRTLERPHVNGPTGETSINMRTNTRNGRRRSTVNVGAETGKPVRIRVDATPREVLV